MCSYDENMLYMLSYILNGVCHARAIKIRERSKHINGSLGENCLQMGIEKYYYRKHSWLTQAVSSNTDYSSFEIMYYLYL